MAGRKLTFSIFRYNPHDPDSKPHMQDFVVDEHPRMTLFTVLTKIREEQDPGLQFDFVCRAAICGSCGMMVNGKAVLACRTRTQDLPEKTTLMPLPFFKLVGDLSVDTGTWFREIGERIESWVHTQDVFNPTAEEERMSNDEAMAVYELDRCIECGCCLAACGTAQMREDFVGAAGLMRMGRFLLDPRDRRSDADIFDVIGSDDGVFGCVGLMGCDDACPKDLPMVTQMGYIRTRLLLKSFGKDKAKA
jgi:fumarate reductase iron-sulfur subunit